MIPGDGVHANALLPGDGIHLAPHDIHGTDAGGPYTLHIECEERDVQFDRVRRPDDLGPDLLTVFWHLGSMTGATVYGPTSLIPLLHRVAS